MGGSAKSHPFLLPSLYKHDQLRYNVYTREDLQMDDESDIEGQNAGKKPSTRNRKPKNARSDAYVNVNRAKKGYRDKYRVEVDKALMKFKADMGKNEEYELSIPEWKRFFSTILIPLDKEREAKMIDVFKDERPELNKLLVLHNTKAGENLAEVYFKRYQKDCPTKWYDLDDFKQMANEGLAIAAEKFDPSTGNKFITYATWWMLNRVRKPYSEKGALVGHSSLDEQIGHPSKSDPNSATLEETLSPEDIAVDWNVQTMKEDVLDPAFGLDAERCESGRNAFMEMAEQIPDKAVDGPNGQKMLEYLVSVVESKGETYDSRQIFLYLFKKVFSRYATDTTFQMGNPPLAGKLSGYLSETAKSKADLLRRLHMNERQYEVACRKLTRKGEFNGI